MQALAALLASAPEKPDLRHVLDFQAQGVHDEVWIPQVAAEGWIIITGDRGKRGKQSKGEKLPILCRKYDITHVMFSGTLQHKSGFEKNRAIVGAWPELVKLPGEPKGSGWLLRYV